MSHHPVIIFLLVINPALFLTASKEGEWEKSMEKDEIIVYTRKVESSPFKEILADAEMYGSIQKFRQIITGIENYTQWMPDCKSAKIIENPSPNDITYHMKLKVPFPFSNRDIIQQIILNESNNKLIVDIINRPNKIEKEKNWVRMLKAEGRWTIEQISHNMVSIKFQYAADPGGGVPAWMVNTFIVKNPHKTLQNVREMMAKE